MVVEKILVHKIGEPVGSTFYTDTEIHVLLSSFLVIWFILRLCIFFPNVLIYLPQKNLYFESVCKG